MSFGPIMRLQVNGLQVELAPLTREAMSEFVKPGLQQASVSRYLSFHTAYTEQDELEWFDKTRADKSNLVWGIWVVEDGQRKVIGNTSLNDITRSHTHQATSGSQIFRTEYWGKGIAGAIHKARTWYAFQHMGLHRVKSAVIQGNVASRKALEKSGYSLVYVERNEQFVDGSLRGLDNLECLNPNEPFWSQWWHGDRPTKRSLDAKKVTIDALAWASKNVELP